MIGLCSEETVRADLRERCRKSSQKEVAKKLGLSSQFINDVLHWRRAITTDLIHKMGYIRIVQYQKIDAEE